MKKCQQPLIKITNHVVKKMHIKGEVAMFKKIDEKIKNIFFKKEHEFIKNHEYFMERNLPIVVLY